MPRLTRHAVRGLTVLTAVAIAYVSGVATGVVGGDGARIEPSRTDVVDEAAEHLATDAARPVSPGELQRAAVAGMVQAVDDPWARYYTPGEYRDFRSSLDNRYYGVGLWLRSGTDRVEVASVQPGSPAARAGVRPGDAIVAVDGRSVADADADEVASALRGRPDTRVSLAVRRDSGRVALGLVRAEMSTRAVTVRQAGEQVMTVRVREFTDGVGRRVRAEMSREPSRYEKGVVLDLRGNAGGLLDEAVEVASAFLSGGPVVSYVRHGEPVRRLAASSGGDSTTPLVVLVDGGTASAAEIVAGALRDRGRAVIVGSRTFGKSSVQEARPLPDGSALELTVGRYLTPSGRDLDGVGIEPDVPVAADSSPRRAHRRALDVLAGLVASQPAGISSTAGRG